MTTKIFQKVGWTLIAVGLIDIGYMIYCFTHKISYSSSFNIFAVIAGVCLLRQNIRAAKTIAFFSAFFLSGFTGASILFPLLTPFDLLVIRFKLDPLGALTNLVFGLAVLALIFWVYRQMTSEPIMEARRSAGLDTKPPVLGFVAGTVLTIGLSVILMLTLHGSNADKAKQKASEKFGNNYKYHVISMHSSNSSGRATLTAYNNSEIKDVQVEW